MSRADDCIKGFSEEQEQLGLELNHYIKGYEDNLVLTGKYTKAEAHRIAQDAAISSKAADIARQRRQHALQIIALNRAAQQVSSHPAGKATGVMSLMVKDLGSRAGYSNVDMRALAHLGRYHQHFAEGLQKLRTTLFGLRQDKGLAKTVVRELFGENTGNAQARRIARAWSNTAEIARNDFNRAGGAIPKRKDWGLPQIHDSALVGKVSRREWVDFTIAKLDPEKMLDDAGRPIGDLQLRETLDRVYDTIRTDGLSDLVQKETGRGVSGRSVANRHRDHRFLVFKDADSWLEYMERFGPEDIYATMTDHLHRMSQETAIMEVMGPNPQATYRYLRDVAVMDGMGQRSAWFLDNVFDEITGAINNAKWVTLADFGRSVRNFLAASKLGAAMLSAVSDFGFISTTSRFRGLPVMRVFKRQLSLLNPRNEADRLFAVRQGLTADAWVTRALAANRFTEVTGSGFTARLADFTMRASGLSAWTDAGKKAFGMEMQATIAEYSGRTFDELDKPFREMLSDYNITPDMWDTIRSTKHIKAGEVVDETPGSLASPGEEFLVYRIGSSGDLANRNAGNADSVARHILNNQSFDGPGGKKMGDRIFAYKVTADDIGEYSGLTGGQPKQGTAVGRTTRGTEVAYSFPEGGSWEARLAHTVPLDTVMKRLKEKGYSDFDDAGTNIGAATIREVFDELEPGAKFFSPDQLMRRPDLEDRTKYELATKIQEMILTETKNAVPEPDARSMAIVHTGTKRGTVVGELWRGGMLFKTFPITALTNHLYRGALTKGAMNKATYLAQLTVSTTILGALALQLKELSKGKDPRPMTDSKFWAAAYMQGGGAGIYGDFLFSDVNRFGQGPFKTFTSGPMGELADRTVQLTYGNVQQLIKGEKANVGGDVVNFMRGYSPGVSLWYTRLAYDRLVLDTLDELADEGKARQKARRREAKMIRDYNQRFWWEPGDKAPDRPPDISNITKETR